MTFIETLPMLFLRVILLVSSPTGGLIYQLVLLLAFFAAVAIALGQWRKGAADGRLFWASAGLFLVRLGLLGVSLAAARGLTPEYAIVPPVDRAASTLTILLILWAINFPKPSRLADALTTAGVVFTVFAMGISLELWFQVIPPLGTVVVYNGSAQESVWEFFQVGLLFCGAGVLLVRRRTEWLIGLGLVLLLFVVHILQLVIPLSGNVPGLVRLVEIVALPLFTALVYRRSHRVPTAGAPMSAPIQLTTPTALSPSAVNSRALLAMASLSAAVELEERRQNVTLALAHLFQADLAQLILPPDKSGLASVACCYRVARGEFIVRADMPIKEFPAVAAALGEGQSALLAFNEHEVELRRWVAGIGLESIGQGLVAPLAKSKDFPLGVVVLVTTAARPAWTGDDERLLVALTRALAGGFDAVDQMAAMRHEADVQQARADQAEAQRQVVQESAEKLMTELAAAQSAVLQLTGQLEMAQRLSVGSPDVTLVAGEAAGDQAQELTALRAEVEQLRRQSEERNRLEVEMEAAQEGVAALQLLQAQFKALSEEADKLRATNTSLQSELDNLQAAEAQAQPAGAPGGAPGEGNAESQTTAHLRLELEMARMELQQSTASAAAPAAGDAQHQSTAQLRLDLELARMELQKAAERETELLERFEKDRQALAQETQTAVAAARAELEGKEAAWQQSASQRQEREAELTAQLAQQAAALEQAQHEAETRLQAAQAVLATAEAALAEKTQGLARASEQHQQRETELAAELERIRAEREAALAQAEREAQARVQEAQAALAEKTQALVQAEEQHRQREAELTVELERIHTDWQGVAERQAALEQAEKDAQARVQEAQAALAAAEATLAEKTRALEQAAEQRQQRETELTTQLAQLAEALERGRAEWQQAADRQAALEKELQAQAATGGQEALTLARTTIAGQAAAVVSMQQKLSETERELAETVAALQAARQAETEPSPQAQATLEKVAALAQDLRQPVMSISGYVSLLLGESVGLVGAVQKKFLERIQASCERLDVLLNDLTLTTDAAAARTPLTLSDVDMRQLVETVLQDSEALVREKGIHLRLELDENLPALQADPKALRQVLGSLVHNAASASALNGEVGLSIRRETQTSKEDGQTDCIFVAVHDSGAGIAPEDLPKVFAGRPNTDAPIAGLGDAGRELAALRPLVEAHHGRIWVMSEPGQGSTFNLLLPVSGHPAKPAHAEPPAGSPADPPLPMPKTLDFVVLPPD